MSNRRDPWRETVGNVTYIASPKHVGPPTVEAITYRALGEIGMETVNELFETAKRVREVATACGFEMCDRGAMIEVLGKLCDLLCPPERISETS